MAQLVLESQPCFVVNAPAHCFTGGVPLDLFSRVFAREPSPTMPATLAVGAHTVPLQFVRNTRARRYLLRLTADGTARVTVPRGGSLREAFAFTQRHETWLLQQLEKRRTHLAVDRSWKIGTEILFRGERVQLEQTTANGEILLRFADQTIRLKDGAVDLRPLVEAHLCRLATQELPPRTVELEKEFLTHTTTARPLRRVTVRNQRSRWGSCSVRGTVSLNWRLVQAPLFVRDYIIFHELAHLREMNHSARYWAHVERACSGWREAEKWLKQNASQLR